MTSKLNLDLSAPLDVELDITSKCQLNCSYCSAAPLMGRSMETLRAQELIEEMGKIGVFSLLLSGGEPTTHTGILEILASARSHIPKVTVNTNGIRLSKMEFAISVNKTAPEALISISLDATDEKINDVHRGTGGSLAHDAIVNCSELGQPVNISCVLTDNNIDVASNIIDVFYPRVKRFSFFPRVPRSSTEKSPYGSEFWAKVRVFMDRIENRIKHTEDLNVMLPFEVLPRDRRGEVFDHVAGCCCAFTKMYINTELSAYPCYYSAAEKNILGKLGNGTLLSVWRSEQASLIRSRAKTECLCGVSFFSDQVPVRYLDLES